MAERACNVAINMQLPNVVFCFATVVLSVSCAWGPPHLRWSHCALVTHPIMASSTRIVVAFAVAAVTCSSGAHTGQGQDTDGPVFSLTCGEAHGVWLPPMATAPSEPPPPPAPRVAGLLGIPYADPPLGREGRWKPPRQATCWRYVAPCHRGLTAPQSTHRPQSGTHLGDDAPVTFSR